MTSLHIALAGLLIATAVTGYVDLRTLKIPNRLVALVAIVGVVVQISAHVALAKSGEPWLVLARDAAANAGCGILVCSFAPLILFRLHALGGGDVKLLSCVGAWVGPLLGLEIELYAFIAAACYAPLRAAFQGKLGVMLGDTAVLVGRAFLPAAKRGELPATFGTELCFGPAVFAATGIVTALRWSVR